jgi:hypothetical protein
MGQYCYLINREKRIYTEAYKLSGGGEEVLRVEAPDTLARFLEYCRENKLSVECVSDHFFTSDENDLERPFKEYTNPSTPAQS